MFPILFQYLESYLFHLLSKEFNKELAFLIAPYV